MWLRNLRTLEGSGKGYDHFVDGVAWVGSALGLERRKLIGLGLGAGLPILKEDREVTTPLGREPLQVGRGAAEVGSWIVPLHGESAPL